MQLSRKSTAALMTYAGSLSPKVRQTEQLTRLEELRTRTLERQNSVIQQAQQYAQALADGLQLFADAIAELLAKFTGAGMRSLVEEATGLQPVSEQSITGKADAVADIGAQYLLQIGNLNSQLIAAREALGDASPYNTPERTTLEAKIRILQDALGATNSAMAQALDYAAELYQQQIDSILGGLRSEFDVVDPVDAINNRLMNCLREQPNMVQRKLNLMKSIIIAQSHLQIRRKPRAKTIGKRNLIGSRNLKTSAIRC
jgi:hypothetical protein